MKRPKISVCIATYNGEKYIREQLDSILHQLEATDEIIISDDGSKDHTVDIIKSYNDSRIILLENNGFKNPISNFENALKHSSGEYIFLSDQDDIWKQSKVAITMKELTKFDLVLSDCEIVDNNSNIICPSFFEKHSSSTGLFFNLIKNSYMGCCMSFSRQVLIKSLPFPKNIPMHDQWIGLVAELFFEPIFIKKQLITYRRHGSNASPTGEKSTVSIIDKIVNRLIVTIELLKLYLHR